jgi:hypothetical protein
MAKTIGSRDCRWLIFEARSSTLIVGVEDAGDEEGEAPLSPGLGGTLSVVFPPRTCLNCRLAWVIFVVERS